MSVQQNPFPAGESISPNLLSVHGENCRFYFYQFQILRPAGIQLDIPPHTVCLLSAESGAFIHQWQRQGRRLAKSLTDVFYDPGNKISLDFPIAGAYSFYLLEINGAAIKPHQSINASFQLLTRRIAAAKPVCLNLLPLVLDLEDRILLEDFRFLHDIAPPPGFTDAQCLLVLVRAIEKMIRGAIDDMQGFLPGYDREKLEEAAATISADPGQKIRVPELARKYGLSLSRFKTLFRQQFGLTIHQFILKVRMERALDLILHGRLPVGEIAAGLGYANDSSFSALFKKKTGFSPSELRRRAI